MSCKTIAFNSLRADLPTDSIGQGNATVAKTVAAFVGERDIVASLADATASGVIVAVTMRAIGVNLREASASRRAVDGQWSDLTASAQNALAFL